MASFVAVFVEVRNLSRFSAGRRVGLAYGIVCFDIYAVTLRTFWRFGGFGLADPKETEHDNSDPYN